jgi:two-component system chemotaxis response regulator CheY
LLIYIKLKSNKNLGDCILPSVDDSLVKRKTVVAIDDDTVILTYIINVLKKTYDVKVAKDALHGMALLHNAKPNLVLLDINMPTMNGFDFLEHIRKADDLDLRNVPVVFLTAESHAAFVKRAASEGAQGYIVKPLDPDLLVQKIDSILKPQKIK